MSSIRRSTTRTSFITPRPSRSPASTSLDELDPEILRTYEKLGIPLEEQKHARRRGGGCGVRQRLGGYHLQGEAGRSWELIFCSFSEAVQKHPELVQKYLGSVVPYTDNFFAALNAAVFTDGSFVYVPKGVRCPMELSTYFRINAANTGQFERTLIVADEGAYVSYLEGCTAPIRDENQLHAAVVELIALDNAQIKYSTVQNWYPGRQRRQRRDLQLRDQARQVPGRELEDLLDASGDRLSHHLEVSELHPAGRQLGGRVLLGRADQQLSAGRHRHQDDPHRQEHAAAPSSPRASPPATGRTPIAVMVKIMKGATGARNYTQCDSLLIGDKCGAHTFPYIEVKNSTARMEHEASTSKIGEDQIFYLQQRGSQGGRCRLA